MGQEKDVLIIKSDKKWKEFFIDRICGFSIWLIGFDIFLLYCAVNMPDPNKEEGSDATTPTVTKPLPIPKIVPETFLTTSKMGVFNSIIHFFVQKTLYTTSYLI